MRALMPCGVLFLALTSGCSGGGGGSSSVPVVEYKMTDVKPPSNAGTEGGFVYATRQTVAIDIALPYPNGLVTIYEKRITPLLYDTSGGVNISATEQPVLMAQGQSAATAASDGSYHYTETITVPAAATSVYVVPMMGLVPSNFTVSIDNGKVSYSFTKGGV